MNSVNSSNGDLYKEKIEKLKENDIAMLSIKLIANFFEHYGLVNSLSIFKKETECVFITTMFRMTRILVKKISL